MADAGQKPALGPAGGLGGFLGLVQFGLGPLAVGDIAKNRDAPPQATGVIPQRRGVGREPDPPRVGGPTEIHLGLARRQPLHGPREGEVGDRVGGHHVGQEEDALFGQFLRNELPGDRPQDFPGGGIRDQHAAPFVGDHHPVGNAVQDRLENLRLLPLPDFGTGQRGSPLFQRPAGAVPFDGIPHRPFEHGGRDIGLDQVVLGALVDGGEREFLVVVSRQHNDGDTDTLGLQPAEGLHPPAVGELQIEQDGVEAAGCEEFAGGLQAIDRLQAKVGNPRVAEELLDQDRIIGAVFDQQQIEARASHAG